MTHMIEIKNGDMISMAKVVNTNTVRLDKKIDNVEDNLKNLIDCHNRYVKSSRRTIKLLFLTGFASCATTYILTKQLDKLEKKVKRMEDNKIYNEYMRDEAENDCLK